MKQQTALTQLGLVIGIIIVINLISTRLYFRLDFTEDKRYTLSKPTKDILKNLESPVTVTAYFSENLPPDLNKVKNDFRDILVEYQNRSHRQVVYEFINPNENEESERKAQQEGVTPVIISVREKDQMKQQRAYLGAVVKIAEKSEVLPLIQPGSAIEYSLTTAIKKLTLKDKPKIAFLQGHGEPSPWASQQVYQELSVLYNIESLTLNDSTEISQDIKTLVIIDPTDSFPNTHLQLLDNFLRRGGNLYIAFSPVKADLQTAFLQKGVKTGLETWLAQKGVKVNEDFVIDANCGTVTAQQRMGALVINTQISFPYFPKIVKFAEHPLTKGIESLILPFASSIDVSATDSAVKVIPLAFTSEKSGTVIPPTRINVGKTWTNADFPLHALTVAVALTGKIVGNTSDEVNSKLVVISNGRFAVNGEGESRQQLPEDNVNFAVNSIDWLSDETGLVELRTKGITNRPLKQIEDSTKAILKYLNVFLPIILILIYAFIRYQMRLRQKQRWLEDRY